jgi:hypothetical protein
MQTVVCHHTFTQYANDYCYGDTDGTGVDKLRWSLPMWLAGWSMRLSRHLVNDALPVFLTPDLEHHLYWTVFVWSNNVRGLNRMRSRVILSMTSFCLGVREMMHGEEDVHGWSADLSGWLEEGGKKGS